MPTGRTMRNRTAVLFAGALLLCLTPFSRADEPKAGKEEKEKVENPTYKHWAAFKAGATVTHREKIKFPSDSEEGERYHEGTLVKDTTYKLLEVTPEKAVVEVVEAEHGRGSLQESAPFKITYFAKIRKGLGTPKEGFAKHKQEDVEVEAHGKKYQATLVETTSKSGQVTRTQQVWLNDEIPGGIVKDHKVQKHNDDVISESTLEVLKFSKGD